MLVTEYHTTLKPGSPVNQFHQIKHFTIGIPCVHTLILRPLSKYHYFCEVTIYAVLFIDVGSINYWNLTKIIRTTFKKIATMCFGAHLKSSYFLEMEFSSLGSVLWCTHSCILDIIHPTIQELERHKHTCKAMRHLRTFRKTDFHFAIEKSMFQTVAHAT